MHKDWRVVLERLGLTQADLLTALRDAASLAVFQARVKAQWRQLAFQLHPDRGGNIQEFQRVGAVVNDLLRLEPRADRPRAVTVVIVRR